MNYYQIACTKCNCMPCICNPGLTSTTTTNGGNLYIKWPLEEVKSKTMKEIIEQFLELLDKDNLSVIQLNADEIGETKVFKIVVKEKE